MPDQDASTATVPRRGAAALPRPTRSAGLFLLLAAILELLGRLIDSSGVTIAAAAALGAVFSDAVLAPRIDGLRITRDLADRLTAGVETTVRLTVVAPAGWQGRRRPVVVVDEHPALPHGRILTPVLRAGGQAAADRSTAPARRGYWADGGHVSIEAFSPLGGFVRRRTVDLGGAVWVHPAPAVAYPLPDAVHGHAAGSASSHRGGVGVEFLGLREWRSGDAASAVNWRASARRSQLVVVERERPAHTALVVIAGPVTVTAAPLGTSAGSALSVDEASWESAVARSAATATSAVRSGRTVILLNGLGETNPQIPAEILDWFAAIDDADAPEATAVHQALRTAGAGASVLWLSTAPVPPYLLAAARGASASGVLTPAAARAPSR